MLECSICSREFKSFVALGAHISKGHNMKPKEYYNKFLRKTFKEIICSLDGCNNETRFISLGEGYRMFCSPKCVSRSEVIKRKRRKTCLKNFGVPHQMQNKKVKEKAKNTCIENLGVENPLQCEKVRKRREKRCLITFSVHHQSQTEKNRNGARERMLKGGSKHAYSFVDQEKFRYDQRKRMLNGGAAYMNSFIKNPSKPQVELFYRTQEVYPDAVLNYPCLNYSVDVAIPQLKLAIEYDGSIFHPGENDSSPFCLVKGKEFKYHQRRQKELEEMGWIFLRYRDYIPSKEELLKHINHVIK